MKPIPVAIIIVSYKSAALTIACLRTIDQERFEGDLGIKVVVVDAASGDAQAIAEAIQKNSWSSWATVVEAPRNGGFAYGNNLAYRHICREGAPDYIHLLNPDTELRRGAVVALVRFLETHPAVGIAGSSFENLDGSDWPYAFRFPSVLSELEGGLGFGLVTRLLRRAVVAVEMGPSSQPIDWVSGASMMVRRSVFDAVGGLDEDFFLYFEETDFCFRAKKAGFPTWYVPESRVMHIAGQSSNVTGIKAAPTRLPAYWFESRRRYFLKNHGLPYAMAVDALALPALALGALKLAMQQRGNRKVPYFIRDLARHSVLWPRNRRLSPDLARPADRSQSSSASSR
jgi:N-acetylglucosaminyl-diphospho-decaprenol L-rhamnosyltransferase